MLMTILASSPPKMPWVTFPVDISSIVLSISGAAAGLLLLTLGGVCIWRVLKRNIK